MKNNPQVLFVWSAPIRAYKKKSSSVLRFYIALGLLLSLIVVLFGDKILVLPIWATFFLAYVLTITPPPKISNRITKFGIEAADNIYRWEYLSSFYFIKKFDYTILTVVTQPPFIQHIYMVIEDKNTVDKLTGLLSEYIVYQEKPQKTITDKMAEWLTKLMPEEDESSLPLPAKV